MSKYKFNAGNSTIILRPKRKKRTLNPKNIDHERNEIDHEISVIWYERDALYCLFITVSLKS